MRFRTALLTVFGVVAGVGVIPLVALTWGGGGSGTPQMNCPARIDLGERERGDHVSAEFTIENSGNADLTIGGVRTNCGCTGLELKTDQGPVLHASYVVPSKARVAFIARLSINAVGGGSLATPIFFQTNDPQHPTAAIELFVSKVREGVFTRPAGLALGEVLVGAKVRETLDVYDGAAAPRHLASVVSTDPERVRARLLLPSQAAGSDQPTRTAHGDWCQRIGRLEIELDTSRPGAIHTTLSILAEGENAKPGTVLVTAEITGPVQIQPSALFLPRRSANGPEYSATCTLRNVEGKPFELSILHCPAGLSVKVLPDQGRGIVRRLRVTLDPREGAASATLLVKLGLVQRGQKSELELPVYTSPGAN